MSVKCEIVRDLMPLYLDGVCSEESRKTVEEHLQECDTCKKEQQIMSVDIKTVSANTDDKKIAKSAAAAWQKGKKKAFLSGFLIVLSAVLILAGAYTGYHWFSSAQGDDLDALARKASDYLRTDELTVTKTAQRGNYFAALLTNNSGKWYMCTYNRDEVFEDRWVASGGSGGSIGFDPGGLGSYNYGDPKGDAVIIFIGAELSDNARFYTFKNNGITYTCPIENNTVLDIFIVLDGSDDINADFTVLDENLQPIKNK